MIYTALTATASTASLVGHTLGIFSTNNDSPYAVWHVFGTDDFSIVLNGSLDGVHWAPLPDPTGAATVAITEGTIVTTFKAPYMRATLTGNVDTTTVFVSA